MPPKRAGRVKRARSYPGQFCNPVADTPRRRQTVEKSIRAIYTESCRLAIVVVVVVAVVAVVFISYVDVREDGRRGTTVVVFR